jgi:ATP-dependent DNA helicase DinG
MLNNSGERFVLIAWGNWLQEGYMVEIFGREGLLKEFHEGFEFRPEQLEMAEFVLERIAEGENGMVEAGTGVGKTLAYLIPAILYCMENDKRVAVSTETKALQKQIIDKDIELAREVIKAYTGREFRSELCLGSSNYPCRKRFETLITRGRLSKGDADTIERLQGLLESGRIFSRFDISIDNRLWNRIYREPEICNFYSCPYSTRCVFQRARKKWSEADVLIMNHYLFFTNIITGRTYLPRFDFVIFDEAHSVEDIASVQLGFDLSYAQIMEVIGGLYRKNRRNNIISSISKGTMRKKAIASLNRISTQLNSFFEYLRERYLSQRSSVRLVEGIDFGDELIEEMKEFFTLLQGAEDHIDNEHARMEFDILRGRLFVYLQCLISAVFLEREHYVYWVERREDVLIGDIHLKGQPVDISDTMWQEVNSFYESNLYFSATLTVNGDFSFFEKRLGIARHKTLLLDSPSMLTGCRNYLLI